jgi:hypothetical protein
MGPTRARELNRSRGESTRIQLAASSIANGEPWSVRQISARIGRFNSVRAYPDATPAARSTNNAIASVGSSPSPVAEPKAGTP